MGRWNARRLTSAKTGLEGDPAQPPYTISVTDDILAIDWNLAEDATVTTKVWDVANPSVILESATSFYGAGGCNWYSEQEPQSGHTYQGSVQVQEYGHHVTNQYSQP